MGCDWYDFKSFYTSGNAVMVFLKDVKEVYRPGSSNNTDKDEFHDEFSIEEIRWLLDQAKGFKVYGVGSSLFLFMKDTEEGIRWCPAVRVPGPNDIGDDHHVRMDIEKASHEGDDFRRLFELARKLTPHDKKVSFAPGRYAVSLTGSFLRVEELRKDGGPMEIFPSAEAIADYLLESCGSLDLYYNESPFAREFEGRVTFALGKNGEGLRRDDKTR